MRACLSPIPDMEPLALRQLERNISFLSQDVADLLRLSAPIQHSSPQLIALDAAELHRITDFQWSPYYAGTDIYSAVAADPIAGDGYCDRFARSIGSQVR